MKAVIVECSNSAAVALCDDGTFKKLKNRGYSIGQELFIKQRHSTNRMVQKLSICASLALVLLSFVGIGSYSYVEPYSYVSLDINPAIEYALNRYDKVISVSGINDEGQQVVSSIESDIKNQNITTALGVTIGQLEKDNYIVQEAVNHVIVSVCSSNDSKTRSLASRIDTFSVEKSSVCSIDTVPVSKDVKDDADSLGITPGKLALIQAVAETTSDSNFNMSDWTDKTVSELETTIQQASSQSPDKQNPTSVNVVDSEYLSSVLDDNAANKSDSAASGTDTNASSAPTDNQTNTNNNITAGSGSEEGTSPSKPDQTGTVTTPAAGSTTDKTDHSGSADKPSPSDTNTTDNGSHSDAAANTPSEDTSSNKTDKDQSGNNKDQNNSGQNTDQSGTSPSKDSDSEASIKDNNSSKDDESTGSSSKKDPDTLTENSSNKKDPYPDSDPDASEESSNDTPSDDEALNTSKDEIADTSNEDEVSPEF